MPAVHERVHFCGDASFPERRIVDERVLDWIRRIIFGMRQDVEHQGLLVAHHIRSEARRLEAVSPWRRNRDGRHRGCSSSWTRALGEYGRPGAV